MGRDEDSERSLTSYHHRQNRLVLGKIYLLPFFAPAPGAPPSAFTLVSAEMFLLYILTPLSSRRLLQRGFSPFLAMLSQGHYHHCWWALALARNGSILKLGCIASVSFRGSFQKLLPEATRLAPCCQNLDTQTQYTGMSKVKVASCPFRSGHFGVCVLVQRPNRSTSSDLFIMKPTRKKKDTISVFFCFHFTY